MEDILGNALLDFYSSGNSQDIITETNISEADEMPVEHFFRDYKKMPPLEKIALKLCKENVLDVGCGVGSHSLYLQTQGLEVTAIDISEGAVKVTKARGVKNVKQENLKALKGEQFDTILLLMNGTGIFENIAMTPFYLNHLKSLLKNYTPDVTMALALIHHITLSGNIPFEKSASFFAAFSKTLIIEFPKRKDSWVVSLLNRKREFINHFDFYNQDNFEAGYTTFFDIVEKKDIENTERTMYVMRLRDGKK